MLTLSFRTDKPEAELYLNEGNNCIASLNWQAHRLLAETIHEKIRDLLKGKGKQLEDLSGIVIFTGPGSFTGLRIGISVANALADGLQIPIAGASGEKWNDDGIRRLCDGQNDTIVQPEYGSPPHVTAPKH